MKLIDQVKNANGKRILARRAGELVGVSIRTVQQYCERGLIEAETDGTGHSRNFTPLQVAELATLRGLAEHRVPRDRMKGIMAWLRSNGRLRNALSHDHAKIFIWSVEKQYQATTQHEDDSDYLLVCWDGGDRIPEADKNQGPILEGIFHYIANSVLILNLNEIVRPAIERL